MALPKETDPHKLAQRQKQIDFGKNTLGYAAYIKAVPRQAACQTVHVLRWLLSTADLTSCNTTCIDSWHPVSRHRRGEGDPMTPDRTTECSKRTFDGLVRSVVEIVRDPVATLGCNPPDAFGTPYDATTADMLMRMVATDPFACLEGQACYAARKHGTSIVRSHRGQSLKLATRWLCAWWQVKKWRRSLHRWDPEEGEVAQPLVAALPPPPPGRLPPPSAANAELLLPALQVHMREHL